LKNYFTISFLKKEINKGRSIIIQALLKYGYYAFSLEILEHCEPSEAVAREQYYLDLLHPEYNILKKASSRLGHKHSSETIAKLKALSFNPENIERLKFHNSSPEQIERLKNLNANPEFKARRLEGLKNLHANPEYQAKRLEHLKRLNVSKEHKEHLKNLNSSPEHSERLLKHSQAISKSVSVLDTINNETTIYASISEAARALGCAAPAIRYALKNLKEKGVPGLIKKRFQVKPIYDKS